MNMARVSCLEKGWGENCIVIVTRESQEAGPIAPARTELGCIRKSWSIAMPMLEGKSHFPVGYKGQSQTTLLSETQGCTASAQSKVEIS